MPIRALIRDADDGQWLAGRDPVAVLTAATVDQVPAVLAQAEARARDDGLHAVGFLTYEAAAGLEPKLAVHPPGVLPPAWFALFTELCPAPDPGAPCHPPLTWTASLDPDGYRRGLTRIRDYIGAGDTYQVNFSYRLRSCLTRAGADVARRLFEAMIARQPAGFGAFIDTGAWAICCASHELLFSRRGRRLTSRPMKGTAARGATGAEDARLAAWLGQSAKNLAENLMITDMVRNDVGRLADVGSVHTEALFQVEAHPTLWQMTSTVHGDTDAGITDIFRALFPAASITGAPKHRTMQIIRELEADRREIYTGTVGMIRPGGDAQFNVAIRTALVDKPARTAEYGVGGGILWDSQSGEEYQETLTKARILEPCHPPDFALVETMLWEPGAGFVLLAEHVRRLQAGACYFFGRPLDAVTVTSRLAALAATLPPAPQRVRLLARLPADQETAIELTAAPLDPADRPMRVALAGTRAALAGNPLVLHKTTRRHLYDRARREAAAAAPGADDVLLINERGEVTESTIANLVVDLGGTLVTPPVSAGLLPGVYRQHLLDTGRVVERVLRPEHLTAARAVYLANSVRGLWQVELVGSLFS